MVLTVMVGKARPFVRGLLLTVLTLGVYSAYWLYKAHHEVYRQFELERENRDEGVVWLILGLILTPLLIVYMWIFADNVRHVRERLGLFGGFPPASFVAANLFGVLLPLGLLVVASFLYEAPDATAQTVQPSNPVADGLLVLAAVLFIVIVPYAYYRLQTDVNAVWDGYVARMRALLPASAPAPAPPAYSAPHVRARVASMRREHDRVKLDDVDAALALADGGDGAALVEAVRLLDAVDAAIRERARLVSARHEATARQTRLAQRLADGEVDDKTYQAARADLDAEHARLERELAEIEARLLGEAA